MDALVAVGLEKRYGNVQALSGVSFRIRAGEVSALLGPNGAGKSTTVKVLTTLTGPDGGRGEIAGYDVLREPDAVRRSIGYVPQTSGVDRDATGRENLTLQGHIQAPLFFLSSTLIALNQTPHWMQITARFNPVDSGGVAARKVALPATDWGSVGLHLGLLAALSVVTAAFATWTSRVYQRQL